MLDESIFHRGEQAVQKRLGVFDEIGSWAKRVVRPCLPDSHREFYRELPFLVAAARDAAGRPWATLLTGRPGFTQSSDSIHLSIATSLVSGDALEGRLVPGESVGLLGIELATRRRNRVNGQISKADARGFELEVGQSFGNCPQYIREREWEERSPEPSRPIKSTSFDPAQRARIEAADTFFIATGHAGDGEAASHGMDASHRGGSPGFLRIEGDRTLVFPDYAGNNHFNTIGNLAVDGRVGLLFVDFESGGMLQLTGRAVIDWDSPAVARHPGARRLVVFELDEAVDLARSLPIRWKASEAAGSNLVLVEKRRESEDVSSFLLASRDGSDLREFEAGQHLPIELDVPGHADPVRRIYSISSRPGRSLYRISVKREEDGIASRFLHDSIGIGAVVKAGRPTGDFVLDASERPLVLLSAGIGVTPMLSMLGDLVEKGDHRRVDFLHVARDGAHHPFREETRRLVTAAPHASLHVSYTRPALEDRVGSDFDAVGRLDGARIKTLVPDLGASFHLCGPMGFMGAMRQALEALGVPLDRIHAESFGPATIR